MTVLAVLLLVANLALMVRIHRTYPTLAEDRGPHRNEVGQSAPS